MAPSMFSLLRASREVTEEGCSWEEEGAHDRRQGWALLGIFGEQQFEILRECLIWFSQLGSSKQTQQNIKDSG